MILPEWIRHAMLDEEWRIETAPERVAEAIERAEGQTTLRITDRDREERRP